MTQNSVINLGDLAKPATVLIEKISEAVGGLCKPAQIRRLAAAEADASITAARAQVEVSEIQRRALTRFLQEEELRQANMEQITEKALPLLKDSSQPAKMENDWISNFFDKCRLTSDDEMQKIWASILSGEANTPGSFSKRTVNLLGSIDKKDAELFTRLANYSWRIGENMPLVYDHNAEIYIKSDIRFIDLKHLDDIGLVRFDNIGEFQTTAFPKNIPLGYFDRVAFLTFQKEAMNALSLGHVLLTKTGQELSRICSIKPIEGYFEYVIGKWREKGIEVKEVENNLPATTSA